MRSRAASTSIRCEDELTAADGSRFRLKAPGACAGDPGARLRRELRWAISRRRPRRASGSVRRSPSRQDSERLQLLEPFAAWDGQATSSACPLLLKAKGKCTTDHISPAGPWLRFRGHLDRISDNMFIGAVNAFTGETGKGLDQLTGERGQAFSAIARHYKASGLRWVVVGDENYGEGSSREHAAMSRASSGRRP